MSNITIRAALEQRLKTWADTQSPKISVAFQNVAFTKPADGSSFLECLLIPNTTLDRNIQVTNQTYMGFFQVNCWAKQGQGMRKAEVMAQGIVSLFPSASKIDSVTITGTPSVGRALTDDSGWVIVPVLIKYRFDT